MNYTDAQVEKAAQALRDVVDRATDVLSREDVVRAILSAIEQPEPLIPDVFSRVEVEQTYAGFYYAEVFRSKAEDARSDGWGNGDTADEAIIAAVADALAPAHD